ALFFLEWQWRSEERDQELSAELLETVQAGRNQASRRHVQALTAAYVPRHFCGRTLIGGCSYRSGFHPAGSQQCQDHRKTLRPVGEGATGANGTKRSACLVPRTNLGRAECTPREEL